MDCPEMKGSEAAALAVAPFPSDEALVEVLSRLRAKPLFRFKCVSKAWCGLITDRLRCRKFPQTLEGVFSGGRGENFGDFIDLSGRPVPLVDPSFSFLTESPEIEKIVLLGSCNGLVLFGHRRVSDMYYDKLGYIVCNPATQQWVPVPSSGWTSGEDSEDEESDPVEGPDTYLMFDPAVSPHFQLVQFWLINLYSFEEVHIFSSVTGAWRRHEGIQGQTWREWGDDAMAMVTSVACPFNGMLHVSLLSTWRKQGMIVAVGGEGKPSRTMHWPDNRGRLVFIGQSQGRLHCISVHTDIGDLIQMTQLSVWVLEDYDAEKWVLRDNVSFSELFERMSCRFRVNFDVVAIHPDRGLVFFVEHWSWRLISYDMDTKEVCALCALGHDYRRKMTPYIPYFAESAGLLRSIEIAACGILRGMSNMNLISQE